MGAFAAGRGSRWGRVGRAAGRTAAPRGRCPTARPAGASGSLPPPLRCEPASRTPGAWRGRTSPPSAERPQPPVVCRMTSAQRSGSSKNGTCPQPAQRHVARERQQLPRPARLGRIGEEHIPRAPGDRHRDLRQRPGSLRTRSRGSAQRLHRRRGPRCRHRRSPAPPRCGSRHGLPVEKRKSAGTGEGDPDRLGNALLRCPPSDLHPAPQEPRSPTACRALPEPDRRERRHRAHRPAAARAPARPRLPSSCPRRGAGPAPRRRRSAPCGRPAPGCSARSRRAPMCRSPAGRRRSPRDPAQAARSPGPRRRRGCRGRGSGRRARRRPPAGP